MRILFDSKKREYKNPFGCLKQNEECFFNIKIPVSCLTNEVYLVLKNEISLNKYEIKFKKSNTDELYDTFSGTFSSDDKGLYYYYFFIKTQESDFSLYKISDHDTNIEDGDLWQLTVYDENFKVSDDFKGKVMYQIFPDRFYKENIIECDDKLKPYYIHENESDVPDYLPDENGIILNCDFFGGNLKGIELKLDYLKSLGVSIIYLNPVFMAYSNHRYDTCDYNKIDPLLGNENDFKSLCDSAHKKGIKIILDGVFSHTGSNSIYFDKNKIFNTGAVSNPQSPYKSWYSFKTFPDEYESWWGIDTLPCVNENDKSFTDFIIESENSVIEKWMRLGADGYRLDVADELPDEFIYKLRKKVKQLKENSYVVGEVWEDASNKISYSQRRKYFSYAELDSVMNYVYKNLIIDFVKEKISIKYFSERIKDICENYPEDSLHSLMNSLSTHDTPRILTELSDVDNSLSKEKKACFKLNEKMKYIALQRVYTAVFLQYVLPGNTCLYYGDEVGMEGFNDPFNRGFFTWNSINIPLKKFIEQMSEIKNTYSCFINGDIEFSENENVMEFERKNEKSCLKAIININPKEYEYNCNSNEILIAHNISLKEKNIFIQKYGFLLIKQK